MDKLSVCFTRNEEDFLQFCRIIMAPRQTRNSVLLLLNCALSSYVAVCLSQLIHNKNITDIGDAAFGALWGALFILCFLTLHHFLSRFFIKDVIDPQGDFVSPKNVGIDEKGITETSEGRNGWSSWTTVIDIIRKDKYIIVMIDKSHGFLIPERAFATPADADTFHEAALSYWRAAIGGNP